MRARQGFALDELHHEIQLPVDLENFVNGADIGMVEGGPRPGLLQEMILVQPLDDRTLGKHFQRNVAIEDFVAGAIDHTHPAFADFRDDAVAADQPTNHGTLAVSQERCRVYPQVFGSIRSGGP